MVAKSEQDVRTVMEIAAEEGIPVLPRGGGTSQCGQTIGEALVENVAPRPMRSVTAAIQPISGIGSCSGACAA